MHTVIRAYKKYWELGDFRDDRYIPLRDNNKNHRPQEYWDSETAKPFEYSIQRENFKPEFKGSESLKVWNEEKLRRRVMDEKWVEPGHGSGINNWMPRGAGQTFKWEDSKLFKKRENLDKVSNDPNGRKVQTGWERKGGNNEGIWERERREEKENLREEKWDPENWKDRHFY